MKTITKFGVVTAAALMAFSAHAVQIDGNISFTGNVLLDGNPMTATTILGFSGVTVSAEDSVVTGDYDGTEGTTATMFGFTFKPLGSQPASLTQWSFSPDAGTTTYSFELFAPIDVSQIWVGRTPFLMLSGSGIASITGFDDTPGLWSLATSGSQSSLTFQASTEVTPVPEGGMTLALFGIGALVVGYLRRKA